MANHNRIARVYGYSICFVSVIVFLLSVYSLVNAMVDFSNPLQPPGPAYYPMPSLASFENYKVDILKSDLLKSPQETNVARAAYLPDDQTLRTMYEAAKAERIQTARHQAGRSIITDGLLTLVSVLLFVGHWRWMQKLPRAEA